MRRNQITLIHFNAGRWPLLLFFLPLLPLPSSPLQFPLFLSLFRSPAASLLGGTVYGPVQYGGGLINPALMAN